MSLQVDSRRRRPIADRSNIDAMNFYIPGIPSSTKHYVNILVTNTGPILFITLGQHWSVTPDNIGQILAMDIGKYILDQYLPLIVPI